jgi:hypothetical protein
MQCHATAETWDFQHPDSALDCGCCLIRHDHAGLGCRPVIIYATTHLTLLHIGDLMDAAATKTIISEEVMSLWRCLIRPTVIACFPQNCLQPTIPLLRQ